MKNVYIVVLFASLALSCSKSGKKDSNSTSPTSEIRQPVEKLLGVNKDEVFLRSEPNRKGAKIVNQKATEALHETHYISVDKSVKVKILEKENGWAKVQVIEPDWLQFTHIGWMEEKFLGDFGDIHPKRDTPVKLSAFSTVEPLRSKLSANGIGELHSWKFVDGGDWQSITDYFEIGQGVNEYGLRNNLAYYLTSPEEGFVESLRLVLNINQPSEREFAHEKFKEMIRKTFESLGEAIPATLLKSVDKESKFTSERDKMIISMKPEKSKIMTLILEIKTK